MKRTEDSIGRARIGLAAKLRGRPDSEHEMSFNRLVFAALIVIYVAALGERSAAIALSAMGIYALGSVGIFLHILLYPNSSRPRRLFALCWDMTIVALEMQLGDATTAVLFPLFLWIIFGNGFRFGVFYLRAAMLVGLAAFGAVVLTTPFWRAHPPLSTGLMLGLVILPLYAGALIRKLSVAKQQAEAANRAKTQFLASVSHELRTPLNAIIGYGVTLLDTPLDDEQRDMARTMRDAGKALLWQIDSILDFSRIEAGRMPFVAVEFDLLAVLNETRAMLAAQAEGKALRFGLHVSPRVPRMLHGDEHHLREILLNLCSNALKFTEAGSVVVSVDAGMLGGGRVRLECTVSDTGIGIAEEARERIFEGFTQADESILNRFGGTGLGLAICKRLVTHLDGAIGVESELGKGSRFWFNLPMRAEPAAALPAEVLAELPVLLLADAGEAPVALLREIEACGARPQRFTEMADVLAALRPAGGRQALQHGLVMIGGSRAAAAPASLAQALRALDPAGRVTLVLLDDKTAGRTADPAVQRLFNMVLPSVPHAEEFGAALELAASTIPRAERRTEVQTPAFARAGIRVLVAEDNRTNQRVIAKILERAGHVAMLVDNGEAALDALEGGEFDFDIVLMDVNMPKMDGIEATKLYRMTELGSARRPIIALTADATPEAVERCIDAGMDACLTKPVEPQRLLEVITSLVAPSTAADSVESDQPATVTDIATHPQFRAVAQPVLDGAKLQELERLGGSDFVGDLIEGFLEDAGRALGEMTAAARKGDLAAFRAQAHAMCSGAANIGARRIDELCRPWSSARDADLVERAESNLARAAEELARVRESLERMQAANNQTGRAR